MRSHSPMWTTATITYTDRLLAFAVPLFVLKVLRNPGAYTDVEFLISLSVVVATFADLGVRNYVLFQYRATGDKASATILALAGFFWAALIQSVIIAIGLVWFTHYGSPGRVSTLIVAALLRASALGATTLAYQLAILHERPALASLPSLLQWLLVLMALCLWPASRQSDLAFALVGPPALLLTVALVFCTRAVWRAGLQASTKHLVEVLRWGWPLLAAAALSMGIANVARIYGFSHLERQDLVAFNFWMRVLSIVQLTHATAMTALTLEIYEHPGRGLIGSNLRRYGKALGAALFLVLILYVAAQLLKSFAPSLPPLAFAGIALYTVLWCFCAYMEGYLARDGHPGTVLKFSTVSAAVYGALLATLRPASAPLLAGLMAVPVALNLLLLSKAISASTSTAPTVGQA